MLLTSNGGQKHILRNAFVSCNHMIATSIENEIKYLLTDGIYSQLPFVDIETLDKILVKDSEKVHAILEKETKGMQLAPDKTISEYI